MDEFGPTPPVLNKKLCEKAYERLVQHPDEQKSELIDLNHAPTSKKLPPAYVVTAQYDVLRDEGEYFAARLFKNNVPVGVYIFYTFGAWCPLMPPVLKLTTVQLVMLWLRGGMLIHSLA